MNSCRVSQDVPQHVLWHEAYSRVPRCAFFSRESPATTFFLGASHHTLRSSSCPRRTLECSILGTVWENDTTFFYHKHVLKCWTFSCLRIEKKPIKLVNGRVDTMGGMFSTHPPTLHPKLLKTGDLLLISLPKGTSFGLAPPDLVRGLMGAQKGTLATEEEKSFCNTWTLAAMVYRVPSHRVLQVNQPDQKLSIKTAHYCCERSMILRRVHFCSTSSSSSN